MITNEENQAFACRLKHYRQKTGQTLEQLAKRSKLSQSYISLLERGEKQPSKVVLMLLEQLMSGHDEKDTNLALIAPHIDPDEVRLLRAWRNLPKSVRDYHLAAFEWHVAKEKSS